jgi:intracellular sulfur oxidation DsrE/DsrF family protein
MKSGTLPKYSFRSRVILSIKATFMAWAAFVIFLLAMALVSAATNRSAFVNSANPFAAVLLVAVGSALAQVGKRFVHDDRNAREVHALAKAGIHRRICARPIDQFRFHGRLQSRHLIVERGSLRVADRRSKQVWSSGAEWNLAS